MRITNTLSLPDAIVTAVRNDPYSRGEADISVTQLIDPPRKVALTEKHWNELTEDASDRLWALFGSAMHTVLERSDMTALAERLVIPVSTDLGAWRVSGRTDSVVPMDSGDAWGIDDYKLTSAWSAKNPKPEWEAQLNVYAALFRYHGFRINQLRIIAVFRDWSKLEALRRSDYPQKQAEIIPVDLWPVAEADEYIHARVRLHQEARNGHMPECTPEERWQKSDVYAVVKDGRKSALRLLPSQEEAMAWIEVNRKPGENLTVIHRPGESTRCRAYCAAAPFCSQWAALQKREEATDVAA